MQQVQSMVALHMLTWQLFLNYWRGRFTENEAVTQRIKSHFRVLPIGPNLILNVVCFNLFFLLLLRAAGFSDAFQHFSLVWIVAPSITGSLAFYHYKCGPSVWAVTPALVVDWAHNFLMMCLPSRPCPSRTA